MTDMKTKILSEPYPCDGCLFFQFCRVLKMSCRAFHGYANDGKWLDDDRVPSRQWIKKTFNKCDNCPNRCPECVART